MVEAEPLKPRSDLGVRTASGIAILALAAGAIWLGGWPFRIFVGLAAIGLLAEWIRLVRAFASTMGSLMVWTFAGLLYVGTATASILFLRDIGAVSILMAFIGIVVATDTGAYFSGRAIGGPKIAPSISPSKTWAGLGGGMLAAAAFLMAFGNSTGNFRWWLPIAGAALAVVAQSGDFFESWMKRRAGVKDSGTLIPGHGGLLDRLDGLLPVVIVGTVALISELLNFGPGD
jgi:phosphatidate cytidylyltransferase